MMEKKLHLSIIFQQIKLELKSLSALRLSFMSIELYL